MAEPILPGDDIPEADLIEQHTPAEDTDEDTTTDSDLSSSLPSPRWDADEADQLDQARETPQSEDYHRDNELDS